MASVAIGTSSGGVAALYDILPKFKKTGSYAILIAVHILHEEIVDSMSKRLDMRCPLKIRMAKQGMAMEPDTVYIMPGGKHGEVKKEGNDAVIFLNDGPRVNYARPSIDVLMKSVAPVFGNRTIGTLLTGMGWDGAEGMKAIKDAGGMTIAQDKDTSAVFAMPKSAIDLGCVDKVLPLKDIPKEIMWETSKI